MMEIFVTAVITWYFVSEYYKNKMERELFNALENQTRHMEVQADD